MLLHTGQPSRVSLDCPGIYHLSRRPGIRSIRSGILTFLASYYGVYQVCYLPLCGLLFTSILSVSIHWLKYCGHCLKTQNNNKDSGGKLPTPLEKIGRFAQSKGKLWIHQQLVPCSLQNRANCCYSNKECLHGYLKSLGSSSKGL